LTTGSGASGSTTRCSWREFCCPASGRHTGHAGINRRIQSVGRPAGSLWPRTALDRGEGWAGAGHAGRQEVILHHMDTADRQGASGARYQRPYAVPERLALRTCTRTWMKGSCGDCGRCCGFRPSSARHGSRGSQSWPRSAASPRPREQQAMEPRHEQIARIALAAGARYGLALAGGYAVSAHGMGNRPSALAGARGPAPSLRANRGRVAESGRATGSCR
jgi:hypothetical protein